MYKHCTHRELCKARCATYEVPAAESDPVPATKNAGA